MRLFVSYAHVDKAIVKDWIVDTLLAAGHEVWFDAQLVAGQDWKRQLEAEIQGSDALIYAMTPESIASEWCQWELTRAVRLGKLVIPVLMQARTQLTGPLSQLQYVDFTDGPTGDAVARLMGGLQNLSPVQMPSAPTEPEGIPPQAVEEESLNPNIMMKILRDPAWQAVIGVIGIIVTIGIAFITLNTGSESSANPTMSATPATPVVVASRNLDIRSGPGAEFNRIGVLAAQDTLDIRGITEDGLWYQVLLADGTYGWVLAAESFGRFIGNRSVLTIVTLTATATATPTSTSSPSSTPTNSPTFSPSPTTTSTATPTSTLTGTPEPSETLTDTSSLISTSTKVDTSTYMPTEIPTSSHTPNPEPVELPTRAVPEPTLSTMPFAYPCEGNIRESTVNDLRVVRADSTTGPFLTVPVHPNDNIIIKSGVSVRGQLWYEIVYGETEITGWISSEYVKLADNCP